LRGRTKALAAEDAEESAEDAEKSGEMQMRTSS